MTVPTEDITSGPYVGNGISDTFAYDFGITDKTDLRVLQTDDAGVRTVLTVDVDYTVTGVGDENGGDVVTTVPLPDDYQLFIRADISATQQTDFESQGAFYPVIHEEAFDKLTRLIQQIRDATGRSIRLNADVPLGETLEFDATPEERANKLFRFDADGNIELIEFGAIEGLQNFKIEDVAVTSGQTEVTVPFTYVPNTKTIFIFHNGSFINRDSYVETAAKITFDDTLPAGTMTFMGLSTAPIGTGDLVNMSYREENAQDALDARVPEVASMSALLSHPQSGAVRIKAYHTGKTYGGGVFDWSASTDKSDHNGGYIIDPDKTYPTDFTDRTEVYDWYDGTGSTGTGCWVARDQDEYNMLRYGCKPDDNSYDDSVHFQRCLYDAVQASKPAYAPKGVYIRGDLLDGNWSVAGKRWYDFSYPTGSMAILRGDGKFATEFRSADGWTTSGTKFLWMLGPATDVDASFYQKDYTINARGSAGTMPGSSDFSFEACHCFTVQGHNDGHWENIHIKDKVGGGIVHASGESNKDTLKNITESDFSEGYGRRSDLEIQGFPRLSEIIDAQVDNMQMEANSVNSSAYDTVVKIIGGTIAAIDIAGVDNKDYTYVELHGLRTARTCRLSSGTIKAYDSTLAMRGDSLTQWIDSWVHCYDCEVVYLVDTGDIGGIYPRVTDDTADYRWEMTNCHFAIDSDSAAFSPSGQGRVLDMQSPYSGSNEHRFVLNNCTFDPRFKQIANSYRAYQLECTKSKIQCSGAAFQSGSDRDGGQTLILSDNDYSEFGGTAVINWIFSGGFEANFTYNVKERLLASRWNITGATAATIESIGTYEVDVVLIGDSEPSSANSKHDGVRQYRQAHVSTEWYLKAYSGGSATTMITAP